MTGKLALLVTLLAACADHPDDPELARAGLAESALTVVERAQLLVFVQLAGNEPPTVVTGTRDSFVVAGSVDNPWQVGPSAAVSGIGSSRDVDLGMALALHLASWRDEFWDLTLDGDLTSTITATYAAAGDELPRDITVHVTGDLSGHPMVLDACYRDILGPQGSQFGWTGTIDGVAGSDGDCTP